MGEKEIVSVLSVVTAMVWPATLFLVLCVFREPLMALMARFSSADQLKLSVGKLSLEAKAMKELQRSLDVGFAEEAIVKKELQEYLEMRLGTIYSSMVRSVTDADLRFESREILSQKVKIRKKSGEEFQGEVIDLSPHGVGFRTAARFSLLDRVEIIPEDPGTEPLLGPACIVRIEHSKGAFHYGASVSG